MLKQREWWWPAEITKVVDGDTFYATIDRGFDDTSNRDWRLYGVDAWERKDILGPEATAFTTQWFAERNNEFYIRTIKNKNQKEIQTFGRYVAEAVDLNGFRLADALRDAGMLKS